MSEQDFEKQANTTDSSWPLVQQWISSAQNSVEVLKSDRKLGEAVLYQLRITSRSPMGAIALETGGIFFDHGWLRVLGSGSERMRGNLLSWNGIGNGAIRNKLRNAYIVAHDIVGGFFAINGGEFSGKRGEVFYLAPDTLRWESLQMSYSQFLYWSCFGNLGEFYQTSQWSSWENDVFAINGDQGISVYPFLWSNTNTPIEARSRRIVPLIELWNLEQNIAAQLRDLPEGTQIKLHIDE